MTGFRIVARVETTRAVTISREDLMAALQLAGLVAPTEAKLFVRSDRGEVELGNKGDLVVRWVTKEEHEEET